MKDLGFKKIYNLEGGISQWQAEGLEHLTKLPQRHATDWREIAFAGWKINRDRQNAQNRGANEPLLSALFAYSAQGPALSRWDKFNYFSNIFNES